jgi:CheY-like chemotaxis protein
MALISRKRKTDRLHDELPFDFNEMESWGIHLMSESEEARGGHASTRPHPGHTRGTNETPHILLAEDDEEMRAMLCKVLRSDGYTVTACPDGVHLEDRLILSEICSGADTFDLIISDIRMPGLTGLEILEGCQVSEGAPPVILITAFGDDATHAEAQSLGAAAIFDKPFDMEDLLTKVHEIVPY